MGALGHLLGLSMPPREWTSLLFPAFVCLSCLPGDWALHHTPTAACPHPAWSNIYANIGVVLCYVTAVPLAPESLLPAGAGPQAPEEI